VGHQQGLPGGKPDDEALVPGDNAPLPSNLQVALPVLKGLFDQVVIGGLLEQNIYRDTNSPNIPSRLLTERCP